MRFHRFLLNLIPLCILAFSGFNTAASEPAYMVRDIHSGSAPQDSWPNDFVRVGETLFFIARDDVHGRELWKTDGTAQGTTLVKDINPGGADSRPAELTNFGGKLYFAAEHTPGSGRELWSSDGTPAGTVLVKDIFPGEQSSNPAYFVVFQNALYFSADDGQHGIELWKSDGSAEGTVLIDIDAGAPGSEPREKIEFNDSLIFSANHPLYGREPWISDGTVEGSSVLTDLQSGSLGSSPCHFIQSGGKLYFDTNCDAAFDGGLVVTDGTLDGTAYIYDNAGIGFSNEYGLTDLNGILIFRAESLVTISGARTERMPVPSKSASGIETRRVWR